MKIFISPPFGNYFTDWRLSNKLVNNIDGNNCYTEFIPVKGSFTLEPRDGLILQIIKTLRYSFTYKGWVNKIGLRNKGIDYAISKYNSGSYDRCVVSIAVLKNPRPGGPGGSRGVPGKICGVKVLELERKNRTDPQIPSEDGRTV